MIAKTPLPTPVWTPEYYQWRLRNDLMMFVERAFYELNPHTKFIPGRHQELICSKLRDVMSGKIKRLIINQPPRSLKSHTASVVLPAFMLGHDPSKKIVCASYGQDLSDKLARDCRQIMNSSFYRKCFPRTRLSSKQAVAEFETTQHGYRLSTSVGGALLGRGGDLIILDDVMKPEQALSDIQRKAVIDWYQNTLLSRLDSKENGAIIIVMQRLHEEDLVGHVLEQADQWEVLRLPAIAQEDECYPYHSVFGPRHFKRKIGEALHPQRDSLEVLLRIKQDIGEYYFDCQHQQTPRPVDGNVVKTSWLRYYESAELPERFDYKIQSWDTANKTGELNDFSVCTTWGYFDGKFYLLDVFRKRLDYPDLKRAAVELSKLHEPHKILIEDKSSGIALIQELKQQGIYRVEAYKLDPGSNKTMRLYAQSIKFENGKVLLPAEAPWLYEYRREITGFPGGKYDDQVDSTTQALEHLGAKAGDFSVWARLGRQSRGIY